MTTKKKLADLALEAGAELVTEGSDGLPNLFYFSLENVEQLVRLAHNRAAELASQTAAEFGPNRPITAIRPSERVIGRFEGEQAASVGISRAIKALKMLDLAPPPESS